MTDPYQPRATASAAATVANLGPGYDVLGLCLDGPRDSVTAELTDDGTVEIVAITGDDGKLPLAAEENCAGVAARWVLDRLGPPGVGVRLWLDKGLPLGSGLGSSAASSVAAAVAVASLIDPEAPKSVLLDACREGERLATGSPHPDNVAPSLLGGLVVCIPGEGEGVDVLRLSVPRGLHIVCVKPDFDVATADARAALPATVPMADVVHNLAAIAGLVVAFEREDLGLLGRCLADRVVTPHRKDLIDGYDAVTAAALAAGALGAGISGAGPTIFAMCAEREIAVEVASAMIDAFEAAGHDATAIVSEVDTVGARLHAV